MGTKVERNKKKKTNIYLQQMYQQLSPYKYFIQKGQLTTTDTNYEP